MKKLANKSCAKNSRFQARRHRTSTIAKEVSNRPRLLVQRSNKHISAQIIDINGKVVAIADDAAIKKGTKSEKAYQVGEAIAKVASKNNITEIHFDRSGYLYHGRVKQLAEGARAGGLGF